MNYALFLGCNIPARVPQYDQAARAVLNRLGVEVLDIAEFNCCGYPMRDSDSQAFLLSAARNLALAEQSGSNMMVLCKCCFGTLKAAGRALAQDSALKDKINALLEPENLAYAGKVKVTHFLSVLKDSVGLDEVREKVVRPFEGLRIATHYGCHALRPSAITGFDDPVAPSLFDKLVEATGAESVDWAEKTDCCGAPLLGGNDALSLKVTEKKLKGARKAGAHFLCVGCPYCHMQFDTVQASFIKSQPGKGPMASILYPQLLGLSMGIDAKELGLENNCLDISSIKLFLK
ncbi:MAG: CoB--CoM heterodisulfide reductase iron-sulfur subunit B family protein [Desulfatibacillum sp.]|nr:CoB--CoM heterodisulfide reductase iron-sulfur subunit B family protein [Desulfatibacillum sp.]